MAGTDSDVGLSGRPETQWVHAHGP
jgi:hypothetical protein